MHKNANTLEPANIGRWVKGISGNPDGAGRPKLAQTHHVRSLARAWTTQCITRLGTALSGPDSTAIRAAEILLERAWGKPVQPIDMTVITLEDLDQLIAEIAERLANQAEPPALELQATETDEASSTTL